MSFENCKIENYATSISGLPDYPSEAGYTAENLKALFDARSDGEIKEKHNALVDAVIEKTTELENGIAASKTEAITETKAYADSLAKNYDPAGSAAEAETRAKEYADGAIAAAISSIINLDEVGF